MTTVGHNSGAEPDPLNQHAQGQLKTIVQRLERLAEDKANVATDIKEVLAEAKGNGFSPAIIRKVLKYRARDRNKAAEEEALLDLYLAAVGDGEL